MKTFFITPFFFLLFLAHSISYIDENRYIPLDARSCPQNHELAEKELKEYLSSEVVIKSLNSFNIDLNNSSSDNIFPLQTEKDQETCRDLVQKNSRSLYDNPNYSLYRIDNYYFMVTYFIVDGIFDRREIVIFDENFEFLALNPPRTKPG